MRETLTRRARTPPHSPGLSHAVGGEGQDEHERATSDTQGTSAWPALLEKSSQAHRASAPSALGPQLQPYQPDLPPEALRLLPRCLDAPLHWAS